MTYRAQAVVMVGVLSCGAAALGQVVPKIPPAPTPAPEYTPPPAPPQAAPTKAPEPEPAFSLVDRDSSGKLKMISGSVEEAALKAYPFDADRREKVNASLAAREGDIERFVVEHLAELKAAAAARAGIEKVTDFNALNAAREAAKPLRQDNVLDVLMRDSAIGAPQRARLDQVVTEYVEARKKEQSDAIGADVMKIATVVGQQGFNDLTRDVFAGLDRLAGRALPALKSGEHGLTLNDQQRTALQQLPGEAKDETQKAALRAFVLDTLTPEQGKQLLGRFAPAARK